MDFSRRIRKRKCEILNLESPEQLYPFNVKFYYNPPTNEIDLHCLENIVIERVKVLHILEQASEKNLNYDSCVGWKEKVLIELKSQKLFTYVELIESNSGANIGTLLQARKRDYISHFVLRFYFCESDVRRQWFVDREIELFRLKFDSLTLDEKQNFLKANNLNYTPQSYDSIRSEIWGNEEHNDDQEIESRDVNFYKVKFTEVPNLVAIRNCILRNGYAYVTDLSSIVGTIHRATIDKGLFATSRMLSVIKDDPRIVQLLNTIHRSRPGYDFVFNDDMCNFIESVDSLSKKYFPLCARMCHETLRQKHHLKYFGRNQYQLFLKGIGVSLTDSLRFWIDEFTHDDKNKPLPAKYRYQIEYNYGRRGSKVDIPPPSCTDLIKLNFPSFQQCYGCPFRFLDSFDLKATLTRHGLSNIQADEVLIFSEKNDYQLACTKYFELVNDCKANQLIDSPNRYYELCQMIERSRHKVNGAASANNSMHEELYDKHLWEMLHAANDDSQKLQIIDETIEKMSQYDYEY